MAVDSHGRHESPTIRRHDLDALRAFAMLLGIFLHAALSFTGIDWAVRDTHPEPVLGYINAAIHGFRMPVFFLLSGYFTTMLWQRRGLDGLLKQRAMRIALPLGGSFATIIPLTGIAWIFAAWGSATSIPAASLPAEGAERAGSSSLLYQLLFEHDVFMHLWFLWHLCWLVGIFTLVVLVMRALPRLSLPKTLIATPWCLVWLVPLTMLPQAFMGAGGTAPSFGPDTSTGLLPMPHVLAFYAIFFFFGAQLYGTVGTTSRLGRGWVIMLPLAGLLLVPALAFGLHFPWTRELVADETTHRWLSTLGQALYVWLMMFGLIGLCEVVLSRERYWVRYLSDSSYWLYLVHLALVLVGQRLLRDVNAPGVVKFAIIVVVTTTILLISYRYLVRYTYIGWLLNGPRKRPRKGSEPTAS